MQLVREYLYDDIYYINTLNESVLNEEFNIEKIKNIISKIKDKSAALNQLIKKFNESKNFSVRKNLGAILLVLFFINFAAKNNVFNKHNIEGLSTIVAKETTIDVNKIKEIVEEEKDVKPIIKDSINYKIAKASKNAKDLIKDHEKLRLEAYSIGDGKITIGYGHAYPENDSPYNIGDKITIEKAESFFNKDIHKMEEGVKRMLSQWEEKEGIKLHIDQSMFDAMVSMAYNMGISGLRNTEFAQLLKKGDYKAAAEKIKTTKTGTIVKDSKGNKKYVPMPGLITRREQEHNLFTQNL